MSISPRRDPGGSRKPNSVRQNGGRSFISTPRCRDAPAAYPGSQPSEESLDRAARKDPLFGLAPHGVYPVPETSPLGRCALTAPFHPYRHWMPAVSFLLHWPSRRRASPLASMLPDGVRTFLDARWTPRPSPSLREPVDYQGAMPPACRATVNRAPAIPSASRRRTTSP